MRFLGLLRPVSTHEKVAMLWYCLMWTSCNTELYWLYIHTFKHLCCLPFNILSSLLYMRVRWSLRIISTQYQSIHSIGTGGWSEEGLTTAEFDGTSVMCSSNHLTSFAVLVDVTGPEDKISILPGVREQVGWCIYNCHYFILLYSHLVVKSIIEFLS